MRSNDKYLTEENITTIVNLKASKNKALLDKFQIHFLKVTPVERIKMNLPINIDFNWFTGFFNGDRNFYINISNTIDCKTGYSIKFQIRLT